MGQSEYEYVFMSVWALSTFDDRANVENVQHVSQKHPLQQPSSSTTTTKTKKIIVATNTKQRTKGDNSRLSVLHRLTY